MKRWPFHAIGGILLALGLIFLPNSIAAADGLSIAPLEYKADLGPGVTAKGHVDIVNPSAQTTTINLHVAAFREINNQGGLQFYDNPAIDTGIKLDLTSVTLGPHEGARIYFMLYSDKLPSGDVFAAILADTATTNKLVETLPSAQVGTLLLLENGTPPAHHAAIQQLRANWLQIGNSLSLQMTIQNTDPAGGSAIGFIPQLKISTWPYGSTTANGPLLFAGHSRVADYSQPGNYFGPIVLHVATQNNSKTMLIFAMTGYWQWLAPLIVVMVIVARVLGWRWRPGRRTHPKIV